MARARENEEGTRLGRDAAGAAVGESRGPSGRDRGGSRAKGTHGRSGADPGISRAHGIAMLLGGESAYPPAWRLQQQIWELRRRLELPDTLLLLQHRPVITIGRHGNVANVLPGSRLEIVRIDRGGDVTYHGPGQVTGYLIADLRAHELSVRRFVASLEEAIIATLARFGIAGERRPRLTGVWVREAKGGWAKMAAIGVRIARGVSLHGIALNVCGDLAGFGEIVPCGLAGERVTSIERVLAAGARGAGGRMAAGEVPAIEKVSEALHEAIGEVFAIRFRALRGTAIASAADAAARLEQLRREAIRGARKPAWLRTRLPGGERYARVREVLRDGQLHTVCESARCPNCHECWNAGTATFMILGAACTRGCRFCAVASTHPAPPDPREPEHVARAAARLGLRHVVVTSVTRDDLPDGGAGQFVATIRAIRAHVPVATIEVLIPDFGGEDAALEAVLAEKPDILNHNVETVPRLYPHVRPRAEYHRSLALLQRAARAGLRVKSGFMVGLGESPREVHDLLRDLGQSGCEHVTVGQYLQPAREKLPVHRYYTAAEFETFAQWAHALGFAFVDAGPMVRSSYHAGYSR
jgi:lipoic acid synthetase